MTNHLIFKILWCISFVSSAMAQGKFTDVTSDAGINHSFRVFQGTFGGGVAVIDYNNDGWEDLFIAGGVGSDSFYENNGNGTFTNVTTATGLSLNDTLITQGAVAADVNKDGFIDLLVTTLASVSFGNVIPRASEILYINNGDKTFRDATVEYGLSKIKTFGTGAAFGDINGDGYPDLFVGNYFDHFTGELDKLNSGVITGAQKPSTDQFYINLRGKSFISSGPDFGIDHTGFGFGGIFTDFDNDRDLDLYVVNDFGNRATRNRLYKNEYPRQGFTEISNLMEVDFGINAMGTSAGDYDGNGWLDYVVTNIAVSPFMVNRGGVQPFLEQATAVGTGFGSVIVDGTSSVAPVSWGCNFFDYDHDMDLDLFICNGALNPPVTPNPNLFLEFTGKVFVNKSEEILLNDHGLGRGSVTFDYDNDGDLDLFIVNQRPTENAALARSTKSILFRNDASSGNWLKVKLKGVNATTRGLGSRVEIVVNGNKMIREIDGGSSHESHNSTIAHFGLAENTIVDSVIVKWIGGGIQHLIDVPANQTLDIIEDTSVGIKSPFKQGKVKIFPSYFQELVTIEYELPKHTVHRLAVIDELGKQMEVLVDDEKGFFGKIEWDVPNYLKPGLYFFIVYTEEEKFIARGFKK